MPTSLGAGCGRAEGRPKKCQPLSMVTLIMSKFSLVGAESKLVKLGTPVRRRADERPAPRRSAASLHQSRRIPTDARASSHVHATYPRAVAKAGAGDDRRADISASQAALSV